MNQNVEWPVSSGQIIEPQSVSNGHLNITNVSSGLTLTFSRAQSGGLCSSFKTI